MDVLNTVFFWAAVVLSVIAVYRLWLSKSDRTTAPTGWAVPEKARRWLLLAIALAAVLVRVWRFGEVPGGFNQDGAMAAVDAKALADYGTDRLGMRLPVHLTAWGYGQMSSLLSYLMVPFIKLFGLSPVTARLPLLLVSLAGLWCLYLLARDLFGEDGGLIAFAFAAIDPWHILQSRWALDCNLFPHFLIFGLFFLVRALGADRKWPFLTLSMVFFGLSMYCYGVSLYTVPLFLLAACVYLLAVKRVTAVQAVLCLGVYLLVAWPFLLTMSINFFGWDTIETPLFTLPYFPGSVRSNDILFFSKDIPAQLAQNAQALLDATLRQVKDLPWNDVEGFGTLYLFSVPFTVAGLCSLVKEGRREPGCVLLLFLLLAGIWCGLTTNSVNINRVNMIYYPLILLTALGVYTVLCWFPLRRLAGGVGLAYLLAFCLFAHTYFTTYAQQIRGYFFGDFSAALCAVKDSGAERFCITADSQSKGSRHVSEILTLFWHEVDAEYFQGKTTPPGELPYREKYTYESITPASVDPDEDAAYVVTYPDLAYFPEEFYDLQPFGYYYVVTRR